MVLINNIQTAINQIRDVLIQLSDEEYTTPCMPLSGATIGQHVRHVIELLQSLEQGYDSGCVNYEHRKRDMLIETNRFTAIELINEIPSKLAKEDKALRLEADDYDDSDEKVLIDTNYHRELAFNLEHTIHHMALMKVGIHTLTGIRLPEEFGVAYATMKYRRQCAQ